MSTLHQRYQQLTQALIRALAQHNPHHNHEHNSDTRLLAVSKGQPVSKIRELYQLGQRAFGENYLQEAEQKIDACSDLSGIQWHYIGPLQRNKTRAIAEQFDWVHSVDRKLLIDRLGKQRPDNKPALNVLLQMNVDDEQQKSGAPITDLAELAETIDTYTNLRLRGIMGIPKQHSSEDQQRASFQALQQAFVQCQSLASSADTLSMGMSGDWPMAVDEGATMVRIGTALFGPREQ